ncbi:MAG: hypothetical protein LR011_05290 [Verrucomicrobia bacterium]|nr:hypothetical protein [Verrucomicrobiota bacterium]
MSEKNNTLHLLGAATGVLGALICQEGQAQEITDYLIPYQPASLENYNFSLGKTKIDYAAQLGVSYIDNVNLSQTGKVDDFAVLAGVNVRAFYQPSRTIALNMNLFVGYQYYLDVDALNTLVINPGSEFRLEKRINDFKVGVYDRIGVELDPLRRAFISGDTLTLAGSEALNWRRINNTIGTGLTWQPTAQFHTETAYEFSIDRSLNENFTTLDLNRHSFQAGGYYDFSRQFTLGLEGEYAMQNYVKKDLNSSQNNSDIIEIGPEVVIRPNRYFDITAKVAYSSIDYEQSGGINDTENFSGVIFEGEIVNRMTRTLTQSVTGRRFVNDGFGTNYADQTIVGYNLTSELTRGLKAQFTANYLWLSTSGTTQAEDANLFSTSIGLTKEINRKSSILVSYSFNRKLSELVDRDFTQSLVSILFNYDL